VRFREEERSPAPGGGGPWQRPPPRDLWDAPAEADDALTVPGIMGFAPRGHEDLWMVHLDPAAIVPPASMIW